MKVLDFPLLADENIHPTVQASLRSQGRDVSSVIEEGLGGEDDTAVLRFAHREKRVVVTHDSDFGTLAIQRRLPFTGIVYLRPGHLPPHRVLALLAALESLEMDVTPPFIAVAQQKLDTIRVRLRASA